MLTHIMGYAWVQPVGYACKVIYHITVQAPHWIYLLPGGNITDQGFGLARLYNELCARQARNRRSLGKKKQARFAFLVLAARGPM